jgi:hypothetical protein
MLTRAWSDPAFRQLNSSFTGPSTRYSLLYEPVYSSSVRLPTDFVKLFLGFDHGVGHPSCLCTTTHRELKPTERVEREGMNNFLGHEAGLLTQRPCLYRTWELWVWCQTRERP